MLLRSESRQQEEGSHEIYRNTHTRLRTVHFANAQRVQQALRGIMPIGSEHYGASDTDSESRHIPRGLVRTEVQYRHA